MHITSFTSKEKIVTLSFGWALRAMWTPVFYHMFTLVAFAYGIYFTQGPRDTLLEKSAFLLLGAPLLALALFTFITSLRFFFSPIAFYWAVRRRDVRAYLKSLLDGFDPATLTKTEDDIHDSDLMRMEETLSHAGADAAIVLHLATEFYSQRQFYTEVRFLRKDGDEFFARASETYRVQDLKKDQVSRFTKMLFWFAAMSPIQSRFNVVFPTNGMFDGSAHEQIQFAADMNEHKNRL